MRAAPIAVDRTEALSRTLEHGLDALYRFILVRVRLDAHSAEDLLQQTASVALHHDRCPESESEIEPWLRGIARNLIRRHWRDARWNQPEEQRRIAASRRAIATLESPEPQRLLDDEEAMHELLRAIASLNSDEQRLIYDFYRCSRPTAALASAHGTSPKSIESRLYRIRCKLRETLEELDGGLYDDE